MRFVGLVNSARDPLVCTVHHLFCLCEQWTDKKVKNHGSKKKRKKRKEKEKGYADTKRVAFHPYPNIYFISNYVSSFLFFRLMSQTYGTISWIGSLCPSLLFTYIICTLYCKAKNRKEIVKKNIMFHLDNWFQFSDNHFLTLSETLLLSK